MMSFSKIEACLVSTMHTLTTFFFVIKYSTIIFQVLLFLTSVSKFGVLLFMVFYNCKNNLKLIRGNLNFV
jgi:hypothetical protein